MRAPKRAARTGRTTPRGTRPHQAKPTTDGGSATSSRAVHRPPIVAREHLRSSQHRPLPTRRGARGNR
jgi:hypothetical protein